MTIRQTPTSKIEAELKKFGAHDRQPRTIVLAIVAHDLTVGIRSALLDLPSPDAIVKVQSLNEYLHQITGRIYTADEQSGREECELLRDIAEDAETKGLKWVVVRRLGPALRHAATYERAAEIA